MPQRARPVNLDNLRVGIRERLKGWDDHNGLYIQLENFRRYGIAPSFWDFLFGKLVSWTALRPKSKEEIEKIHKEGKERLPELTNLYNQLCRRGDPNLLSIESLEWDDVSPLFELASSIKGMRPPTFGSKLCHFLFPSAYFIWDNNLVKKEPEWKRNYKTYWEELQIEWHRATDEQLLKKELRKYINDAPCGSYPWPTKIAELCQYPE